MISNESILDRVRSSILTNEKNIFSLEFSRIDEKSLFPTIFSLLQRDQAEDDTEPFRIEPLKLDRWFH